MPLKWVEIDGVNLILIPAEAAQSWRGDLDPDEVGQMRDYDRARDVHDLLGLLKVGSSWGLVLNDEAMATSSLRIDNGIIIIRCVYIDDHESLIGAMANIPEAIWEDDPYRLAIGKGGLLLFDSSFSGDELSERSEDTWDEVEIEPGTYQVATADYSPDASTRLILHRFRSTHA
jgi:hypothetical protein